MFKKKSILVISILSLIIASILGYIYVRSDSIKSNIASLRIDSRFIELEEQQAPFVNTKNQIMLPLRVVCENLNAVVDWNKALKEVNIKRGEQLIKFRLGETTAFVNNKQVNIDKPYVLKKIVYVPTDFIEKNFSLKTEYSKIYKTITIYQPTQYLSLAQFEELRKLPAKMGRLEGDDKVHNFEDSNVLSFLPIKQVSDKQLETKEERYNNAISYLHTAVFAADSEYTLNYNKMNEYRNRLIIAYHDKNAKVFQQGKELTSLQWIDNLVEEYASKKAVTQANFYTHPGLIYYETTGKIGVRGILQYKVLEGPKDWWFNSKIPHKVGQTYERDIEVLVYTPIDSTSKKVSQINWLSQPRLIRK